MGRLPAGRVTFVFIDVVGSTRLFSADPDNFAEVIARVQRTIAREVHSRGGTVVKTLGDGAFAAFARASAAVEAMVAVQA